MSRSIVLLHLVARPLRPIIRGLIALDRWQLRTFGTPQKAAELCYLASWEIELLNWDRAIFLARRAIYADQFYGDGYALLGSAYTHIGEFQRARAAFWRGLRASPNHHRLMLQFATLERDQGIFAEAEVLYRRALTLHPNDPAILKELAQLTYQQGNLDEARSICERLNQRFPKDVELLDRLGKLHLQQERLPAALECFDAILKLDRHRASTHFHRAQVLNLLGRTTHAREALQRAIRLEPENEVFRAALTRGTSETVKEHQ